MMPRFRAAIRYVVAALTIGLLVSACGRPAAQGAPDRAPTAPSAVSSAPVGPTSAPSPPSLQARLAGEIAQANQAYRGGQFGRAVELYEAALKRSAGAGQDAPTVRRPRAFARFRLGLASLLSGEEGRARRVLQDDFRDETDEHFKRIAFEFWDAYAITGDAVAACARVSAFAREREVHVDLDARASIPPDEICLLPGSGGR